MRGAYYNEIDPYCVEWLRNLISAGLILAGDVDSRSIEEVQPDDLAGYAQCHFFAGLGGWAYAARLAGWPDDRPLWTMSCPCQPFSVAGKGRGADDPRHLWPHGHRLIRGGRPAVVMGEQVAGAAGYDWFHGVRTDLAAEGYQARAVDIPAASVNAPHQRNRLYWIAGRLSNATDERHERSGRARAGRAGSADSRTDDLWLPDTDHAGLAVGSIPEVKRGDLRQQRPATATNCLGDVRLHHAPGARRLQAECGEMAAVRDEARREQPERRGGDDRGMDNADGRECLRTESCTGGRGELKRRREISAWDDWHLIGPDRDGKYRRIKPGITPLAPGLPGHVGQLRAYGNALCAPLATEVIRAYMDAYDV